MNTELSDEQLGRLWCGRHGKRPSRCAGFWVWQKDIVCSQFPAMIAGYLGSVYGTEPDAYAAVGQALRAVVRMAVEIQTIEGHK